MVCALNNNGANNIWEHALLENGSKLLKKKPVAKDLIRFVLHSCIPTYFQFYFPVSNKNISKPSICNVHMHSKKIMKMDY